MTRLLVIEDDPSIAESLRLALGALGHRVRAEGTGEGGLLVVERQRDDVDLAIVDVMLPGIDGFEVCRRLNAVAGPPVILLTARTDPIDVVVGLECGADDYVTKPVEPRVLDARIKTVLRRTTSPDLRPDRIRLGEVVLDESAMTVSRNGIPVHMTPTELRLLVELVRHRGQVLSRRALLERVWDYGYAGDARLVDAAVQRLRTKVEADPRQPELIVTVRGVGYRLDATP